MTDVDPTRIDIYTDPERRIMEGVARHGNTPFRVPYVTHVGDNLWQGGCTTGLILPNFIKHVVSLYPWERYKIKNAKLKSELYVEMFDSIDQSFAQVHTLATWVNICRQTGPVLVHCQAGLNRSSLVAARALWLDTNVESRDADQVVEHLRKKRSPAVLCNPAFEAEVRSWGKR